MKRKMLLICLMLLVVSCLALASCELVPPTSMQLIVDGEVYQTISVTDGQLDLSNIQPVRDGYTFEGWYIDEALTIPLTTDNTYQALVGGKLYSKWSKTATTECQHTNADWQTTLEPTCTQPGSKHKVCPSCNEELQVEIIPATGHSFGEWITDAEATCTQEGSKHRVCATCGMSETETIPIVDHVFEEWFTDIEPTCTQEGSKHRVCATCGAKESLKIDILEHTYEDGVCMACGCLKPSTGLEYTISKDKTYYTVTSIGTCTDTDIVIPAIHEKKPVTNIGKEAFYDCASLESITIPSSVISIGDYAFRSCESLTSVTFEEGSQLTSIGGSAFSGCTSLTNITIPSSVTSIGEDVFSSCYSLANISVDENNQYYKTIDGNLYSKSGETLILYAGGKTDTAFTIPSSVISIDDCAFRSCESLTSVTFEEGSRLTSIGKAFYDCDSLESITIPSSVTSICDYAFYKCESLESITIPSSVTSIGEDAFYECESLKTVTFEEGSQLTSIGGSAFSGCNSLTNITIPSSVTSIGKWAFYECKNLTSITLPDGVTSIDRAFEGCTSLANISVDENNQYYKTIDGNLYSKDGTILIKYASGKTAQSFIVPEGVTGIGDYAFRNCIRLTSITIPNSVTSIGDYAFRNCIRLTSITIPNSVTSIGSSAFSNCSITSITIPNSVTSIGSSAFYNCDNLTTITFEGDSQLESIDDETFFGCSRLESITIPSSVTSIGDYAFRNCIRLTSITIPNSVTSIGSSVFSNCDSLNKVKISDLTFWCNIDFGNADANPLCYAEHLYLDDKEITNIVIPEGVISIGDYAFAGCNSLTSVTISSSVTSISDYAFVNCGSITSVTFEEGSRFTSIGFMAFYDCDSLESITIPSSVTSIGVRAFSNTAYYNDINNWQDDVLYIDNCLIEAKTTIETYTIKEGTTVVANGAFAGHSSLASITIPSSITSLGDMAFANCHNLTSITIPSSVTSIGEDAFYNCDSLNKVKISDLTFWCNIDFGDADANPLCYAEHLYLDDKEITNLVIPEGVTSIGDYAFAGCNSLTSITIPSSVTSIGEDAFYNCDSLNKVKISDLTFWCNIDFGDTDANPLCYAEHLYLDDKEITNLVIPEGVTSIGDYAFFSCYNLTSVTISSSVTSIGNCAFEYCENLTSITIPSSVTSIGEDAFYSCYSLASISVDVNNQCYKSIDGNLYSKDGTILIKYAPGKTARSFIISEGVTSIGENAFSQGYLLTSITIPSSVTSIGSAAFYDCQFLNEVVFEEGSQLTSIGDYAFRNCIRLTSITIPSSVRSIGVAAFLATSIQKVEISDLVSWCNINFNNNYQANPLNENAANLYLNGEKITELVIPKGVTSISDYAFVNCGSITSVTFEEGSRFTSIGFMAFYDCDSLESITIPSSVTSIDDWAFRDCSGLTNVYYEGTENQWNNITIGNSNEYLTNAAIHYNYTGE